MQKNVLFLVVIMSVLLGSFSSVLASDAFESQWEFLGGKWVVDEVDGEHVLTNTNAWPQAGLAVMEKELPVQYTIRGQIKFDPEKKPAYAGIVFEYQDDGSFYLLRFTPLDTADTQQARADLRVRKADGSWQVLSWLADDPPTKLDFSKWITVELTKTIANVTVKLGNTGSDFVHTYTVQLVTKGGGRAGWFTTIEGVRVTALEQQ